MPTIQILERKTQADANAAISFERGAEYLQNPVSPDDEEQLEWYFEEHPHNPFGNPHRAKAIAAKTRPVTVNGGCFVAGTLIHTQEGLVPIEKIKVGDWVLSQPETQGKLAYKRVVNTFRFEDKPVYNVNFYIFALEEPELDGVVVTGNHPFWVKGEGWTRADRLYCGAPIELADGRIAEIMSVRAVFTTATEGVGWVQNLFYGGDNTRNLEDGTDIDFRNAKPYINYREAMKSTAYRDAPEDQDPFLFEDEARLKIPVYNIEVEDFHTYYVGEFGVWVHNVDCGTLREIEMGKRRSNNPIRQLAG